MMMYLSAAPLTSDHHPRPRALLHCCLPFRQHQSRCHHQSRRHHHSPCRLTACRSSAWGPRTGKPEPGPTCCRITVSTCRTHAFSSRTRLWLQAAGVSHMGTNALASRKAWVIACRRCQAGCHARHTPSNGRRQERQQGRDGPTNIQITNQC